MFEVISKLYIAGRFIVSVKGDVQLIKVGLKLKDEKGNIYEIAAIGTVEYYDIDDILTHAELLLKGDTTDIGELLEVIYP